MNQTISTEDECEFQELENNEAVTFARFNEIYGDSYISGRYIACIFFFLFFFLLFLFFYFFFITDCTREEELH